MSAETLREAARLMRERAEAATPGPWDLEDYGADRQVFSWASGWPTVDRPVTEADAAHIASWHPAVAVAVADWLEASARFGTARLLPDAPCLAVARAYLGEAS